MNDLTTGTSILPGRAGGPCTLRPLGALTVVEYTPDRHGYSKNLGEQSEHSHEAESRTDARLPDYLNDERSIRSKWPMGPS